MKNRRYIRVMLGKGSSFSDLCFKGNFIGTDFGINQDVNKDLSGDFRDFTQKYVPVFLKNKPDKTRVAAGLACGSIWTVSKGLNDGDIVLCPKGDGNYLVGEITGDYFYSPTGELPHRRPVKWYTETIPRSYFSQELKNSSGSVLTTCDVTKYSDEIESLIGGNRPMGIVAVDPTIEDPSEFGMEKHLEEFLIHNWEQTELSHKYDIYLHGRWRAHRSAVSDRYWTNGYPGDQQG